MHIMLQVLAYFSALHIINSFGLHELLHAFQKDSERLVALLTGAPSVVVDMPISCPATD